MPTKTKAPSTFNIKAWQETGPTGFYAFLDDVKPKVRGDKNDFVVYQPSERIRHEIDAGFQPHIRTFIASFPRRWGKTTLIVLRILHYFLSRPNQTIGMIANSVVQSSDTSFQMAKDILNQTPYTRSLIDAGEIEITRDFIRFRALNNVIQAFTSQPASLYGRKLTIAQISELHAAQADEAYQAMASATLDSKDGLVLVDSTTGPRSSPLFGLYNLHLSGEDPSLYFAYISHRNLDEAIAEAPPWINTDFLRSRSKQMVPHAFAQQHLNLWTASSANLFSPEVIEQCATTYPLNIEELARGRAYASGGACDRAFGWSLHGDATTTCCVAKFTDGTDQSEYYVMDSRSVFGGNEAAIKSNLKTYERDFNMSKCAIEKFNAQDLIGWAHDQNFDVEAINATATQQASAFSAVYQAASEGRLHVHKKFSKLLKEMGTLEYQVTASNQGQNVKFQAGRGCKDDFVYGLIWAIYSLREIELNPYEIDGIHCTASKRIAQTCILNGGDLEPFCSSSCPSLQATNALYDAYKQKAGCAVMSKADFVRYKLVNVGTHSSLR